MALADLGGYEGGSLGGGGTLFDGAGGGIDPDKLPGGGL
jgi:hypothetical protein